MTRERLDTRHHAIYELGADLLLVHKPEGHRESEHAHAYGIRVRVLRGRLAVHASGTTIVLDGASAPHDVAAETAHSTEALAPTWVVVERLGGAP